MSKKIFFTVGPSKIYPTLTSHIKNAVENDILSISHRGSQFKEIYGSMTSGIRKLLNVPETHEIIVLSSALEAMDRVIQSMSHNNTYHILTGNFGKIWMNIASDLGKSPEVLQFFNWDTGEVAAKSLDEIKIPKKSELVCITQNDTSTGFSIPMSEIYKLQDKNPDKLFALDIVSSVPYVDIEYKKLDAVFFSVQKGFGLPAGLSILILSPKAISKAEKLSNLKGYSIGSYHNILKLSKKSRNNQTNETPNVLGIYLLDCVLKDMLKIGVSSIRKRLDKHAGMMYSFFSKQSLRSDDLKPESYKDTLTSLRKVNARKSSISSSAYKAFIKEEKYRSVTDPVFEIIGGSTPLIKFAAEKGLVLGAGYSASSAGGIDFKEKHIRVANFPAIDEADIKKLFKVVKEFYS